MQKQMRNSSQSAHERQPPADGRTTVLLTGFGPFPSVPVNATMMLVPRLAQTASRLFPSTRFVHDILATEWETAPKRVDQLLALHSPDLILHFGVSSRARGFEIETRGRNACVNAQDASGACPDDTFVSAGGQDLHPSRIPVAEIVRRLRRKGIAAYQSWNAGTYLCNATLYHVLTSTQGQTSQAGFVHIPTLLAAPGRLPSSHMPLRTSPGCPLTWQEALQGSLEIIATCLDKPSPAMQNARIGSLKL